MRWSWAASSRATVGVSSVEWSSLMTISMFAWVCARSEATARGRRAASL
ncbi:hypothetical protein SCANM63S_06883 [Streptomyces canarius]